MRFEKTLKNAMYQPWKASYVDYAKLKELLREHNVDNGKDTPAWSDEDESRFVDELVNVQLEKVNSFQVETYKSLRERTSQCEATLEEIVKSTEDKDQWHPDGVNAEEEVRKDSHETQKLSLDKVHHELDGISKEINELEKYSRLCFTAFLKAAKKHDRRRGSNYKVRPLLQVRLAQLPFAVEDYSPLLYRLSAMYSFVRQILTAPAGRTQSISDSKEGQESYSSYKFFVHPENLIEVKTYILRCLPVLVYNPQTSKIAEGSQRDPTITSLYFDNPRFSLYTRKVEKAAGASSLRLRWFGQLEDKPELVLEKKTLGEGDESEEIRFNIKEKYIMPFINGDYKMEKSIQKLRERRGDRSQEVLGLERNVSDIQSFIRENELQPVLRANYTRTAFQIPGDNKVRISIDTNLALIREDSLDLDRPCRDQEDWHRSDIDATRMEYPFPGIKKGEVAKFPYALLEIKVKDGANRRKIEWVEDLMSSHLVKEAPRFSKFVHGVAQLFEDYINTFPFWLSVMDTDIRRDPNDAFQEEQEKRARHAQDEFAVGSFMGAKSASSFKPAVGSPAGKSTPIRSSVAASKSVEANRYEDSDDDDGDSITDINNIKQLYDPPGLGSSAGLRSLFSSFSTSKYARAHQRSWAQLPLGVRDPGQLIKDMGPIRVEPKVWLANQRTFIKWEHISVLLASLSLGLYNGAGKDNDVARGLAVVYTLIALFTGMWGWWMYLVRSHMIEKRSGKDFDNIIGPIVVCIGLIIALCLNFGFMYHALYGGANDLSPIIYL